MSMRIAIGILVCVCALIPAAQPQAQPQAKHDAVARHVIQISVDGLNASLLKQLMDQDTKGQYANFKRLMAEGAYTLNARTDFTQSDTLPNHTCMLTGRPVAQPKGWDDSRHHGYTANSDPGRKDSLHSKGNTHAGYIASTFDVAHDNGLSTALYASKSKFVIYTQSYDAERGRPDAIGADNGRCKIDTDCVEQTKCPDDSPVDTDSSGMHKQLLEDLSRHHFNYTFVHYRECDTAGHARGWGSPQWNQAVHMVDTYLGELLKLVETDPQLKGTTAIVLTADHGGTPDSKWHHVADKPTNYTIPFIVWGAGVARGADLYQLNSKVRLNPAGERFDYAARQQPIRNGDSGNLALVLLGLPSIPGSSINAAQDLRVSADERPSVAGGRGTALP